MNRIVLPPNFFTPGKPFRITATGRIRADMPMPSTADFHVHVPFVERACDLADCHQCIERVRFFTAPHVTRRAPAKGREFEFNLHAYHA